MSKAITIEDIARQAGVSASTVSRVLNGNKRVAEAKRALVLAAIEQHQYRPSAMARGLVRGRSMTIGVLVQDIVSPFFAQMVLGVEQGLDSTGYQPMLMTTHWRAGRQVAEAHTLQLLLEREVDGLIVLAGRIPEEELRAVAARVPIVIVARRIAGLEAQCLPFDNQEGAYRATRYLLALGHTRIAHIAGPPEHPDASDRRAGFLRALAEVGVQPDPDLIVEGKFTAAAGLACVEQLLTRGEQFSAIFTANDQTAYGAMLGLFNHGYHVPTDMSLVAFDDQHLSAYTLPPLTTVRQPMIDMGRAAAEGLLRLLDGEEPMLPEFPAELIIRKSALRLRHSRNGR